jgi:hypothetical protein
MNGNVKRFASAAVIVGTVGTAGAAYAVSQTGGASVYGIPFTHNGQQYYLKEGSKRVVYPSKQACLADVPSNRQAECEAASNYNSGSHYYGRWYGPVYDSGDTSYRPNAAYPTESASGMNTGKSLPSSASKSGFGATGKSLDGGSSSTGS